MAKTLLLAALLLFPLVARAQSEEHVRVFDPETNAEASVEADYGAPMAVDPATGELRTEEARQALVKKLRKQCGKYFGQAIGIGEKFETLKLCSQQPFFLRARDQRGATYETGPILVRVEGGVVVRYWQSRR